MHCYPSLLKLNNRYLCFCPFWHSHRMFSLYEQSSNFLQCFTVERYTDLERPFKRFQRLEQTFWLALMCVCCREVEFDQREEELRKTLEEKEATYKTQIEDLQRRVRARLTWHRNDSHIKLSCSLTSTFPSLSCSWLSLNLAAVIMSVHCQAVSLQIHFFWVS